MILAWLLALQPHIQADGCLFKGGDASSYRRVEQNEQVAAIHWADGLQRMVIACRYEAEAADKALWIFPLPSGTSLARVEVVESFPRIAGFDATRRGRSSLSGFVTCLYLTQGWPMIYFCCFSFLSASRLGMPGGVRIDGIVERWGIRAEVLAADSHEALAGHLARAGVNLGTEALGPFREYLDGSHLLVVAWISSRDEVRAHFGEDAARPLAFGRSPCLYVEFPAPRPFYPMKPTSSYGATEVPVRLYLMGTFVPECDPAMRAVSTVEYFDLFRIRSLDEPRVIRAGRPRNGSASHEASTAGVGEFSGDALFFTGPEGQYDRYTLITCRAPASTYTSDFSFASTPGSARLRYARWVDGCANRPVLPWVLLLTAIATLSYVAGGLVGVFLFRAWHPYALVGLGNVATLAGVYAATRCWRGPVGERLRTTRYELFALPKFVVLFSALFVLLAGIVHAALWMPFWFGG